MFTGLFIGLLSLVPAAARTIEVEFLQGTIDQKDIENLDGLACRNYDHVVHIDISVDWPTDKRDEETADYKRLKPGSKKAITTPKFLSVISFMESESIRFSPIKNYSWRL
jgi:hypothetical protein